MTNKSVAIHQALDSHRTDDRRISLAKAVEKNPMLSKNEFEFNLDKPMKQTMTITCILLDYIQRTSIIYRLWLLSINAHKGDFDDWKEKLMIVIKRFITCFCSYFECLKTVDLSMAME